MDNQPPPVVPPLYPWKSLPAGYLNPSQNLTFFLWGCVVTFTYSTAIDEGREQPKGPSLQLKIKVSLAFLSVIHKVAISNIKTLQLRCACSWRALGPSQQHRADLSITISVAGWCTHKPETGQQKAALALNSAPWHKQFSWAASSNVPAWSRPVQLRQLQLMLLSRWQWQS